MAAPARMGRRTAPRLAALAMAAAVVAAAVFARADAALSDAVCEVESCLLKDETTVCDRWTTVCPVCLYEDRQNDVTRCVKPPKSTRECPPKYTQCPKGTLKELSAAAEVSSEASESSSSGSESSSPASASSSSSGSATSDTSPGKVSADADATPSTTLPATLAPPPTVQTNEIPNQTAKASAVTSTAEGEAESGLPSWVIISAGIVVGCAVAVVGSIVFKRRRESAAKAAGTNTPFEDANYEYSKKDFSPNAHAPRPTGGAPPSPSFACDAPAPSQSKNDSDNKGGASGGGDHHIAVSVEPVPASSVASAPAAPPQKPQHPPFRQTPAAMPPFKHAVAAQAAAASGQRPVSPRESYKKQLPPFKPAGATAPPPPSRPPPAGWGAMAPPPTSAESPVPSRAPIAKQKKTPKAPKAPARAPAARDSWATNNFDPDEFATNNFLTLAGSDAFSIDTSRSDNAWLDTNYMDVDGILPSSTDDDDDSYLNSTSAGTDLYTSLSTTGSTSRPVRTQSDEDDLYPDTSVNTTTTAMLFTMDSMRQRDTATFGGDEIIDLSRREGPAPVGRKQAASKWKDKYYMEL